MVAKTQYVCNSCGSVVAKWQGQCPECGDWNCLVESAIQSQSRAGISSSKHSGYAGMTSEVKSISDVKFEQLSRMPSGMQELDRVLGGGIVPGSVVLIGGDPGVGKSSILLQTLCHLSQTNKALYVTGEESLQQVAMRAKRMTLPTEGMRMLAETDVDLICQAAKKEKPEVMVIDSIQTMQISSINTAPGGVSQVRESAAVLTQFAKQNHVAIFLVGHVTKSGEVAGPRVLEHIVDSVIYLEGKTDGRYRTMRALKNRFGAVNELGVFAMTDKGMKEVKNPSAIFLTRAEPAPGSIVTSIWEGSRPLLVEIQALLDQSYGQPRRLAVGADANRLLMLLAVLHRHAGIQISDQDVFVNVVGGIKVSETGVDLALIYAMLSSLKNRCLPQDLLIFGEVGLSGEIRPVPNGEDRLKEAAKHGFRQAIVPDANVPKKPIKNLKVHGLKRLDALFDCVAI